MPITIWHNPACGTSRNTLAMIRATGVEPVVVEYLKTPPDRATLERVATSVGGARALLRKKAPPYVDLALENLALTDAALVDAMLVHPILIERPVVITPRGTALCRPSERVLELLDAPLPAPFTKEDGEVVAPAGRT
jgi:arsenate reductase (glutaredoxin)